MRPNVGSATMTSATRSWVNEMDRKLVKVAYHLEPNEEGFPPISIELLNAEPISDDSFRIKNAPFFAPNVSYHDLVRARHFDNSDQLEFVELIEASKFTSISIILLDSSMDKLLMDLLRGMNCVLEYGEFGVYRVLAVAVPPIADYPSLRAILMDLESRELISFAELSLPE